MYTDFSWIMGMDVAQGLLLPGSLLIGYATRPGHDTAVVVLTSRVGV